MITRGVRARRADRGAARRKCRGCVAAAIDGASVEERTDPGLDQGEDPRGAAAVLPQAFGTAAVRAARRHGDLTWRRATLSRRVSEFVGVALFAVVADLADLARQLRAARSRCGSSPPASDLPPANFAGRSARSSPSCRSSCSATPPTWSRWRSVVDRLALLLVPRGRRRLHQAARRACCSSAACRRSSSLAFGTLDVGGKDVPRRRLVGDRLGRAARRVPQPHRLDHPDPDAAVRWRSSCRRSSRSAGCSRRSAQMARERWAAMRAAHRAAPRRERRARSSARR